MAWLPWFIIGLMRVVPLLSSSVSPTLWRGHAAVELVLEDGPPTSWIGAVRDGLEVHALHAPDQGWTAAPADLLRTDLGPDFLVLPAEAPADRTATTALLQALEFLLELTAGRGPRLVLRPAPGSARALASLLDDLQGHALGFCWDASLGADLVAVEDRILCAVATPGADLAPLARLGYRWNVALPASTPEGFERDRRDLQVPAPAWLPPEAPPGAEALRWGSAWGGQP